MPAKLEAFMDSETNPLIFHPGLPHPALFRTKNISSIANAAR